MLSERMDPVSQPNWRFDWVDSEITAGQGDFEFGWRGKRLAPRSRLREDRLGTMVYGILQSLPRRGKPDSTIRTDASQNPTEERTVRKLLSRKGQAMSTTQAGF